MAERSSDGEGPSSARGSRDRCIVKSVRNACDLLEAFEFEGQVLRLSELMARTGLSKSAAFRILHTIEKQAWVEHIAGQGYRSNLKPMRRRKYRLGYAAQGTDYLFSREVSNSIERVAQAEGVDLLVVDNRYDPKKSVRNAEFLIKERVDLAIEFQTDEHTSPVIAAMFLDARIPLIAIDIPHPGAIYFGADNYQAGLMGGRSLGRWAKQHWHAEPEELILMELPIAGSVPRSRLTGTVAGLREVLPAAERSRVVYLDGNGRFEPSLEAVRRHLRTTQAERILVSGINDPSVLGALRALDEAGRSHGCAAVGQNASPEGRAELVETQTRFIASVAYFPEKYGDGIIPLALNVLNKKRVPAAVFMKHQLITSDNVYQYYPSNRLPGR